MRRSAMLGTLLLLSSCSGLGKFFNDTERLPGQNPNAATGVSENVLRSRGQTPTEMPIEPQAGNVWPGPPQPLPSLSDVSRNGGQTNGALLGGASMRNGGSMAAGEQQSIHSGAPLDQDGFGGGGGSTSGNGSLAASVPDPAEKFHTKSGADTGGKIVIPNGDGTNTVINPDGSVQTVKGFPK